MQFSAWFGNFTQDVFDFNLGKKKKKGKERKGKERKFQHDNNDNQILYLYCS